MPGAQVRRGDGGRHIGLRLGAASRILRDVFWREWRRAPQGDHPRTKAGFDAWVYGLGLAAAADLLAEPGTAGTPNPPASVGGGGRRVVPEST